jgi:coatomer protein complex subunit epsilon
VDAVALIVQIHLQQNRTDLALKEVTAARRWAQDSLLVNLAEAWVGVRVVRAIGRTIGYINAKGSIGRREIPAGILRLRGACTGHFTFSVPSLIAQAVCEIHLGRLEEAQSALEQAVEKDPKNAEGIANLLVLNAISGNNTDELTEYVTNILDCRMHC